MDNYSKEYYQSQLCDLYWRWENGYIGWLCGETGIWQSDFSTYPVKLTPALLYASAMVRHSLRSTDIQERSRIQVQKMFDVSFCEAIRLGYPHDERVEELAESMVRYPDIQGYINARKAIPRDSEMVIPSTSLIQTSLPGTTGD